MKPDPHAVPEQKTGAKKDIMHSEQAADDNDARKLFMIARNRLVSVNRWHEYSDGLSAVFQLTDGDGTLTDRTAETGDYFRISVPGAPGPADGDGYDWVRVEAIEDRSDPDGPHESMIIQVRPASDPNKRVENVAHFFSNEATSSFVIERNGKTVTAAVYGRNETPNTGTENVVDKVRNAVVGLGAMVGFANVQWKNLVKGLVRPS